MCTRAEPSTDYRHVIVYDGVWCDIDVKSIPVRDGNISNKVGRTFTRKYWRFLFSI